MFDVHPKNSAAVIARNPGWQVMAQVSLGEFLASPDREAYGAVNAKRVDFALMDPDARVTHAIEYQGSGHHQGTAAARDAVKKEALRRAGIGYHEVVAGHTTAGKLQSQHKFNSPRYVSLTLSLLLLSRQQRENVVDMVPSGKARQFLPNICP
ncbi:DUF2726 domain-containing protein [Parasphingorhabdus sp.]|uniref:DUF2726 domain-containing protein n=1 Tax=Parasphingorhabdus sp. TaxID=2709688 RepID=UPI0039E3552E